MSNDIYSFIDTNIVFLNTINFLAGLFIIIYNLKGLDDCDNIIILSSISSVNSLITISWCFNICNNRLCSFIISLILLVYNVLNYHSTEDSCIQYFNNNAKVVISFYIANIFLQIFNVISYIILFILAVRILNKEKNETTNRNTNMNRNMNMNKNTNINRNMNRNTKSIYDDDIGLLNEDLEKII